MGWIQDRLEQSAKMAEATKVLLLPESNLDASDPNSLVYDDMFETLAEATRPEITKSANPITRIEAAATRIKEIVKTL